MGMKDLLFGQLHEHLYEDDWFPSAKNILKELSAEEASWAPSGKEMNTIWQIMNHLNFYNQDVIYRLRGETNPVRPSTNEETFGAPGDPRDDEGWQETVTAFFQVMEEMRQVLALREEASFNQAYRPNRPSVGQLIGSIMMHNTYHLGQVVLLRKMRNAWPGSSLE